MFDDLAIVILLHTYSILNHSFHNVNFEVYKGERFDCLFVYFELAPKLLDPFQCNLVIDSSCPEEGYRTVLLLINK